MTPEQIRAVVLAGVEYDLTPKEDGPGFTCRPVPPPLDADAPLPWSDPEHDVRADLAAYGPPAGESS